MSQSQASWIISNGGVITVIVNGKHFQVEVSHPNYDQIKELVKNKEWDKIENAVNVGRKLQRSFANSGVVVEDGAVSYNGEPVHNAVVDKMLEFAREGFCVDHLVKFLGLLMENPSKRSVDSLYEFLERHGLVIDEEGYFLAYKSVRNDWFDHHSGTIKNEIGATIKMARNKISDDPSSHCSYGLHVGSIKYVLEFGGSDKRVLLVRVNPKDVVSVPSDCDCQKMRVCEYTVLEEYTDKVALVQSDISEREIENWGEDDELDLDEDNWDDEDEFDDWDDSDEDDEDDDDVPNACGSKGWSCEHGSRANW